MYSIAEKLLVVTFLDFKARYKPTRLGMFWSLFRPGFQLLVFYTIFGYMLRYGQGPAYVLELFLGLVVWSFFADATMSGGMSIVGKPNFVSKIKLPLWIIPGGSMLVSTLNFILALSIFLIAYLIFFEGDLKFETEKFIIGAFLVILISFCTGTMLASIMPMVRDFQAVWELVLIYGIFLSPIVFYIPMPEDMYRYYYSIHILAYPIEMIKSAFFADAPRMLKDSQWQMVYMAGVCLLLPLFTWLVFTVSVKRIRDLSP